MKFLLLLLVACDNMSTQRRPEPDESYVSTSAMELVSGAVDIAGGQPATSNTPPIPLDRHALERGADRYAINCVPCHGPLGDGDGMVARRGYAWVPSFHAPDMRKKSLSQIYNVISFGTGAMPAYASQLEPDDRWRVALYIRALQLSQHATLADVPKEEHLP